jgi:hypothetical protein
VPHLAALADQRIIVGLLVTLSSGPAENTMTTFAEIVDAADRLSADEQLTLLEILRRRLADRNREQLVRDVADARAEFMAGGAQPASVKQIMDEVGGDA